MISLEFRWNSKYFALWIECHVKCYVLLDLNITTLNAFLWLLSSNKHRSKNASIRASSSCMASWKCKHVFKVSVWFPDFIYHRGSADRSSKPARAVAGLRVERYCLNAANRRRIPPSPPFGILIGANLDSLAVVWFGVFSVGWLDHGGVLPAGYQGLWYNPLLQRHQDTGGGVHLLVHLRHNRWVVIMMFFTSQ